MAFAFPTWQDAVNVSEACARGDRDEVDRLYRQSFDAKTWGFPGEDSEDKEAFEEQEREMFDSIRDWQKDWLESALKNNHIHMIQWFSGKWEEKGLTSVFEEMSECIANIYLKKLCVHGGTVEDALRACGKEWWPDESKPYEARTGWAMEYEFNYVVKREVPTVKKFFDVDPAFALTSEYIATHPDVVFFTHRTPSHVVDALQCQCPRDYAIGVCSGLLVSEIIRQACDYYGVFDHVSSPSNSKSYALAARWSSWAESSHPPPDSGNGSRLIGIADELVNMGFAFDDRVFFLMDNCAPCDHSVRRLMSKMVRIHGGRERVQCKLPRYDDSRRRTRVNVTIAYWAVRLVVAAIRARKRTWAPSSVHVAALGSGFSSHLAASAPARPQERAAP